MIDNNWLVWMIDHTRAFRMSTDLKEPKNLARCDKEFLARMKQLDAATLSREFGGYTNNMEIQGLLKRRDKIVETFERMGPSALYSSPRRPD
ncbi:MAG: hypothetical protein HY235_27840 [Acidobacteria bacterium]|nr:hypothetical protein [Acidobacteriota bacterium]